MYNNFIYFILVLLVFTSAQPSEDQLLPWWGGLVLGAGLFGLYLSLARSWFTRLAAQAARTGGGGPMYFALLTRLSILAVILFTVDVFFLGFKDMILTLPLAGSSTALTGLGGLALFAVYLCALWAQGYPAYASIFRSRLSRTRYVWSQLRFNLPIVMPWLILSGVVDLTALLPWPVVQAWLNSQTGEMVFFFSFLVVLVVFMPAMIRPLWGLTPVPAGPQREAIEAFCRRNGFTYREIMLWPLYEGEGLTAGVMGVVRRWRYILITRSLMRVLDDEEMAAVLGHELGHVRRRHLWFYAFFLAGYLVLAYSFFDLNLYIFLASDWTMDLLLAGEGSNGTVISLMMALPIVVVMVIYFRFVFGAFMRNFERQADLFAFKLTGTIQGLVSSLEKIAFFSGQSRRAPSWHHFSVAERVDFLVQADGAPSLIRRHDRKVRLMIGAYCLGLVLAGWAGYQIHQQGLGENLNRQVALRILQAEVRRNPAAASAHRLLGDLYIQLNQTDKALAAYERAVALAPTDAESLNNLAWTLATQKNATTEDKARALLLARRAADLKPAHYILDTLAESLYVNGLTDEALEAIEAALRVAKLPEDRAYLRGQRRKFEAALDQSSSQ